MSIRERDAADQTGTALGNLIGGNAALRAGDRRTLLTAGDALAVADDRLNAAVQRLLACGPRVAADPGMEDLWSELDSAVDAQGAALAAWEEATDGR